MKSWRQRAGDEACLWLAQGLGLGRLPVAPGTFGSVLGLVWFFLCLAPGSPWLFFGGTLIGLALSVVLCGRAERVLALKDPASVVFDEIAAIPVCFVPWVMSEWIRNDAMPDPAFFFTDQRLYATLVVFALFRIFDIVKPWPVKQSQRLRGGWGVTADDLLAALYVALMTLVLVV